MQGRAAWKDEEEPDSAVGNFVGVIELDQLFQQQPCGDRSDSHYDQRADNVVTKQQCGDSREPGKQRIKDDQKPRFTRRLITVFRERDVVNGVPTVPDGQYVLKTSNRTVREHLIGLRSIPIEQHLDSEDRSDQFPIHASYEKW